MSRIANPNNGQAERPVRPSSVSLSTVSQSRVKDILDLQLICGHYKLVRSQLDERVNEAGLPEFALRK